MDYDEFARKLFSGDCKFIAAAQNFKSIPEINLPEIAFLGRSNVGKSSLINSLTNRNRLAKVSNTPGRTKQLIFFMLSNKITLVDLPGYGYAKTSKKEIFSWEKLIYQYLQSRKVLKRVCLLIDSRRGLKDLDIEIMKNLDNLGISYQIILTKCDKIKADELLQLTDQIYKTSVKQVAMCDKLISTSSRLKGEGIKELREEIAKFCQVMY